jgi:hypothetical protein
MSGRASRDKGKRGEREAAAELASVLACEARRGVQYQGGPGSPDVVLEGVAIHVEAKRVERLSLWAAMEQAKADAPAGSVPIVWHRCNRRESVVIVETSRLYELAHTVVMSKRWNDAETSKFEAGRTLKPDATVEPSSGDGPQGAT